jgi:hypothetical protein
MQNSGLRLSDTVCTAPLGPKCLTVTEEMSNSVFLTITYCVKSIAMQAHTNHVINSLLFRQTNSQKSSKNIHLNQCETNTGYFLRTVLMFGLITA